jgi:hypothetical protein
MHILTHHVHHHRGCLDVRARWPTQRPLEDCSRANLLALSTASLSSGDGGPRLFERLLAHRRPDESLDLRMFDGDQLRSALDELRDYLNKLPERRVSISRAIFGAPDDGAPPVDLTTIAFPTGIIFDDVSFIRMRLDRVRFAGCRFLGCDFRYVQVAGSNFRDTYFHHCDFYSATFGPASVFFGGVTFDGVSLGGATLSAITGLTQDTFDRQPPALIQENSADEYRAFLQPTIEDRDAGHPVDDALAAALLDAAAVYRSLSHMWADQGETSDARFAYVKSKMLERQYASPWRVRRVNRARKAWHLKRLDYGAPVFFRWLWLCFSGALRYGDSFMRVAGALVAVTLIPATVYSLVGGVQHAGGGAVHGFFSCWLFSIEQVTASPARHLESSRSIVDLVGSLETVMTITLLGLLGSAFANRLRGS